MPETSPPVPLAVPPGMPVTIPMGKEFREFSGLPRTKQRELIRRGELVSYRDGKRRMIATASYLAYIERRLAAERRASGCDAPPAASLPALHFTNTVPSVPPVKRGRGRPRKYPQQERDG